MVIRRPVQRGTCRERQRRALVFRQVRLPSTAIRDALVVEAIAGVHRFDTADFQRLGMHGYVADARMRCDKAELAARPAESDGDAV